METSRNVQDIVLKEKVFLTGEKLANKRKQLQDYYEKLEIDDIDDESFMKMWDLVINLLNIVIVNTCLATSFSFIFVFNN